ncbi:hypothetical protein [Clostridium sp. DSM 8431]|uniref:hypothetical protein n=1 Tax=Clostridium sp. DSM 8431 TaxID=1761781 RepID=UPI001A9A6946|nr:hypothetical protein [Clostridium sp. DSM 8431]
MPDKNYVVYKILLNDIDITSSIQNNTFIIHNISEDYTLKIWFTLNEKYKNSSIDNLAIINNQITKEFSKITLPYINNFIKTGDKNFFIICSLIFTAILSLIYLSYYIGIKINSFTIYQNKYSLPLLYLIYPLAESI